MLVAWTWAFFGAWVVAMVFAIWAINVAQRFAMRVPRLARRRGGGRLTPRVAVIVPIKGVDDDTATNVAAVLEQDYPCYRVIFAVESNEDSVVPLLEKIAVEDSRVEIVIGGLAEVRGQKVQNQLAAVSRTTADDEVLAFMDADAKPKAGWLRALVTPLTYGKHIGATSGYRYYIPMEAHNA